MEPRLTSEPLGLGTDSTSLLPDENWDVDPGCNNSYGTQGFCCALFPTKSVRITEWLVGKNSKTTTSPGFANVTFGSKFDPLFPTLTMWVLDGPHTDGIVADEVGCAVVPGSSVRYCALTRERQMKSGMRLGLEDMGEMLDGCLRSDGFLGGLGCDQA